MSSRVRKPSDGTSKIGPMKATLPMASLLRGSIQCGSVGVISPMRHISPEHALCGHRSPGALTYKGLCIIFSRNLDLLL